ncbi:PAS domain S-box protein [Marinobacterium rhizophilum]|uniref:hybrid sensor histidine kinase/response regulator n=1 Tax=Marinobacterium rhizophilum TaxID=420402 RepID=UPI00146B26CF|nr:PAS domain S-box protein [Marinobacterium rhizophilum]
MKHSIEEQRLREALFQAAEAVTCQAGGDIFKQLVRRMTLALGVQHALIGTLLPGDTRRVQVIAAYSLGRFVDSYEYDLVGTPCEQVIGLQYRYFPRNMRQLFPDPHLVELGIESYAAIPLFDSQGNTLGLMAVMNDRPLQDEDMIQPVLRIFSTRAALELERQQYTSAHKRSEIRYRTIFEAALDSIISMDSNGNIIDLNPSAEACFGYRKSAVIGKPLADMLIPARFRDGHKAGLARFLSCGKGDYLGRRVEVPALAANGEEIPVELTIEVARDEGDETIFIGYLRDIRDRVQAVATEKRLQSQLRQAQKMQAIGQLTGGIAHDFNNILTTVMGYIVLAQEQAAGYKDPVMLRYLDRIHAANQRASHQIQQLLTFSRGQQGQRRPIQLSDPVYDGLRMMDAILPPGIQLTEQLGARLPAVLADPMQIEQILMNLCINARDALNGCGEIHVSLGSLQVQDQICASCHATLAGDYIELQVADTGSGMDAQTLERIFEPFYSTKTAGQGSGMGLAMIHGIVHEHHGHILVNTAPQAGANFHILLPPCQYRLPDDTANVEKAQQKTKMRGHVLLVDDEATVAEFMADLLSTWGLQVSICYSGPDALTLMNSRAEEFDIVITDQTMPDMTGIDLAREIRALRPDLPMILYSGFAKDTDDAALRQAGIHAFFRKPVDTDRLRQTLSELLAP